MPWQYHLAEWRSGLDRRGEGLWSPDIPLGVPFACLDLRPRGFGTGLTLVATPRGLTGFKDTALKFGEAPSDTVPPRVVTSLGNRLGLTLAGATVADILTEMLTTHADNVDPAKWNGLRPTNGLSESVSTGRKDALSRTIRRARPTHEIYLGGLVTRWRDPALEFDFSHGSITEEDAFSLGNNVDIDTTNPDTTNDSTNAWTDNGANNVEGDGSGRIKFSADGDFAAIDTTFVDGKAVAEYDPNNGTNNELFCIGRSDNVSTTFANNDQYHYKLDNQFNDDSLAKWVSTSRTELLSSARSVVNTSDYSIGLSCNGTTIKGFYETPVTDSPLEVHSTTDTSIDGTTVGGSFWGFGTRNRDANLRCLRWFFDDLAVAGGGFPTELLRRRPNTLLRM